MNFSQSLEEFVNTRVYLAGLDSSTTVTTLEDYGRQFGTVLQAHMVTRGSPEWPIAGIIKFSDVEAAKSMIEHAKRALGLQASFARINIKKELLAATDPLTTNLYMTNLPRNWSGEDVVRRLFPSPRYEVKSCRVLYRYEQQGIFVPDHLKGPSRGVAFARLATRDQAEQAIRELTNRSLVGSELPMMVRFADNSIQRSLKAQTSSGQIDATGSRGEARKGPPLPLLVPTMALPYTAAGPVPISPVNAQWPNNQMSGLVHLVSAPTFGPYMPPPLYARPMSFVPQTSMTRPSPPITPLSPFFAVPHPRVNPMIDRPPHATNTAVEHAYAFVDAGARRGAATRARSATSFDSGRGR